MPNMLVFRPADANEVTGSYACALSHARGPSVLALSRQNVPNLAASTPDKVKMGTSVDLHQVKLSYSCGFDF